MGEYYDKEKFTGGRSSGGGGGGGGASGGPPPRRPYQTPPPSQKKSNSGWYSWPVIIILFAVGAWPIALALLFLNIFSDSKRAGSGAGKKTVSYDAQGRELARTELETAGADTVLSVEPEEKEFTGLAFVPVALRDGKGTLKMTAAADLTVSVDGPGRLLAFGCAKPDGEPDFYSGRSATWNGRALAVVQSTGGSGAIRVTASAPGLMNAVAELISK